MYAIKYFLLMFVPALILIAGCMGDKPQVEDPLTRLQAIQEKADGVRNLRELAPQFRLVDIKGKEVSSESLQGKPYIIQGFASWCYSCIDEARNIHKVYQSFKDKGLAIVYISIWEDEDNVTINEFRQAVNISEDWYWSVDKDNMLVKFDLIVTDSTRLVDKDGYIVYADDGFTSPKRLAQELGKVFSQ